MSGVQMSLKNVSKRERHMSDVDLQMARLNRAIFLTSHSGQGTGRKLFSLSTTVILTCHCACNLHVLVLFCLHCFWTSKLTNKKLSEWNDSTVCGDVTGRRL